MKKFVGSKRDPNQEVVSKMKREGILPIEALGVYNAISKILIYWSFHIFLQCIWMLYKLSINHFWRKRSILMRHSFKAYNCLKFKFLYLMKKKFSTLLWTLNKSCLSGELNKCFILNEFSVKINFLKVHLILW
jgi:hypothetical protein